MLEIRNLVAGYDARSNILNGISLSIAAGERVAILGPSGTGKTTLFRAINGFVPARSGTILVDGIDVAGSKGRELRSLRCRVGVVSQRQDLVDNLRVYQNVMAGALGRWSWLRAARFLIKPTSEELNDARAALARVGLEDKLLARTTELSGGQRQRVAIARALIQKPVLLLADEPVASLDPALSEQVLALLSSLCAESNVALLCSLHQPHLAEQFFPRIIEMKEGVITGDRPASRFSFLVGDGI